MTDASRFDGTLDPDMLSAYLDGEVTDSQRAAIVSRLEASPEWRAELAEVRAARDALRGLPVRDAPAGMWEAVHAHVGAVDDATDDGNVVPIASASSRARRRWGWIAASAAAVAAVVAVVVVPHRSEVSPNVATVVAQHGAQGSDNGDPVSMLAPVGPLVGFRR